MEIRSIRPSELESARGLLKGVMGEDRRISWVLNARRPRLPRFYEKLGFTRAVDAMERRRSIQREEIS